MNRFEFTLTEFRFPKNLPNPQANFRFVVDLRFIDDKGRLATEQAVMPGLDTFWECAKDEHDKLNYVRACDSGSDPCAHFNMTGHNSVHEWDRMIHSVKAEKIHSIQFTVFDVDRKDAWDRLENFLKGTVGAVIGNIKAAIPGILPSPLPKSFGGAADDVQSFVLKKLAGGDKVLFRGSVAAKDCLDRPKGSSGSTSYINGSGGKIVGQGKHGSYEIGFCISSP